MTNPTPPPDEPSRALGEPAEAHPEPPSFTPHDEPSAAHAEPGPAASEPHETYPGPTGAEAEPPRGYSEPHETHPGPEAGDTDPVGRADPFAWASPPQPEPQSAPQPQPEPQAAFGQGEYQPWAARFGLVRPRHGRYIAGVCAAIGRATNTDPLLWRVIIGVLSIFGVGIFLYLAVWLLTPAEGDSASPLEALFGRGYSTTSSAMTIALAIVAVILVGGLTNSFLLAVAAGAGLVVAAIAANPRNQRPVPVATLPVTVPAHTPYSQPYTPPFAPHGPYAGPPPPAPAPVRPPRPKREPSRLGRLIFGIALLAVGVLGLADLAGVAVPGVIYVAVPLAIVGLGLIVGAWLGRARGYVWLGVVLCLLLPIASDGGVHRDRGGPGTVLWNPPAVSQISDSYEHRFGEATLDLSGVDFNGHDVQTAVNISFGDLQVIVPPNVDVIVESDVNLGDASVFGQSTSGAGVDQTFRDDGEDGPGGGTLRIRLQVKFAHAEVIR